MALARLQEEYDRTYCDLEAVESDRTESPVWTFETDAESLSSACPSYGASTMSTGSPSFSPAEMTNSGDEYSPAAASDSDSEYSMSARPFNMEAVRMLASPPIDQQPAARVQIVDEPQLIDLTDSDLDNFKEERRKNVAMW